MFKFFLNRQLPKFPMSLSPCADTGRTPSSSEPLCARTRKKYLDLLFSSVPVLQKPERSPPHAHLWNYNKLLSSLRSDQFLLHAIMTTSKPLEIQPHGRSHSHASHVKLYLNLL